MNYLLYKGHDISGAVAFNPHGPPPKVLHDHDFNGKEEAYANEGLLLLLLLGLGKMWVSSGMLSWWWSTLGLVLIISIKNQRA